MFRPALASAFLTFVFLASPARSDEFALRDGDTVVFLGDSLTAARTYGLWVENYTLLRYPDRKVRFINAGWGGDTAEGGLKRLERDVFNRGATVVTVMYGTNDIGWGVYADEAHKKKYLDSIRGIVEACKKRGVRVFICSEPVTAEDPYKSENGFLQKMCEEGMKISRDLGEGAIDVQRTMREIQKRVVDSNKGVVDKSKHNAMHVSDGVHLNDLGQLAVAYAILKGLGAPDEVSSVEIDAAEGKVVSASGCKVSDVSKDNDAIRFTRLDAGLPLNGPTFFALNYRFIPIHDQLAKYSVAVRNLSPGKYDVLADGRKVGSFTSQQLAGGVNIAFATPDAWQPGGPWMAQAQVLKELTDARSQISVGSMFHHVSLQGTSIPKYTKRAEEADEKIVELQRTIAQPRPYKFVIQKAAETPEKK